MKRNSEKNAILEAAADWVARRDAGLSKPEAEEFEQWLAADARHGAAFERFTRAWALLDRPLLAGEQDALAREIKSQARRRRLAHRKRVAVAAASAAASVVLVLAVLWQSPRGGAPVQPPREASVATIISPERRVLADGSTVELRQGAAIDARYDDDTRRVVLVRGEAHFQVTKGLSRPFVVVAGGIEVRAVGTAFAVGLGEKRMEVWVTEGQVAVEKPVEAEAGEQGPEAGRQSSEAGGWEPGAGGSPSPVPCPASLVPCPSPPGAAASGPVLVVTLGARERVVLETAPALVAAAPVVTTVTPAEINERLAWRVSSLEFAATPLAEAVALINQHSRLPDGSANARLVLDGSLAGRETGLVSGYFPASDIEAFVRVLGLNMDIEGERQGSVIVLRKKEK